MVRQLLFLWLLLIPLWTYGQSQTPVRVFADLDRDIYENMPIMGTLSVEHPDSAKVEKESIRLKNGPLTAEQIKQVKYSPNDPLTLTIFRFQLPPRDKGLYALDEISVSVGGKTYHTVSTSFEVKKKKASLQPPQSAEAAAKKVGSKPLFILEAFAEPSRTLYPGQKTKVGYRYYFNRSIEATKEILPLLEAEGFKKVGGKIARSAQNDDLSLLEVSQEIEAVTPGVYTFGPSVFEGVASDANGQEILPAMKGEAEPIKITVVELPVEIKPPSYKNAIGKYTFDAKLDSNSQVEVGEKMRLKVTIKGSPLEGVELPDLCCQPGMAGRFHFSDIPPAAVRKDQSLQFVVDIRPMDSEIREIPILEFAYFDPEKGEYVRTYSKTIPIKVKPIIVEEEESKVAHIWPKMELKPQEIRLAPVQGLLSPNPLSDLLLGWWGLMTIPVAAGVVLFQVGLKRTLEQHWEQQKYRNSQQLLMELTTLPHDELAAALHKCFLLRLAEQSQGPIASSYEELSDDGVEGRIKAYLLKVDAWHYGRKKEDVPALIKEAEALYKELQ